MKQSREIAGPVLRGSSSTLGLFRTCHRGAAHDGFTAHKRLKGKNWKTEFPPFGGEVRALNRIQVQPRVFLGIVMESTDRIACDQSGEVQQCTDTMQTFFHAIRGVLWDPNPLIRAERVLPAPIPLVPKEPALVSSCAGHQEAALRTRRSREVRIHCKLPCV